MNQTYETTLVPKNQTIIIKEMMTIEPNKVSYVIGPQYSNLHRLKEIYGVDITLVPVIGGCQIIIVGPINMVPAAKKDIKEGIPWTTSFCVEKDYIGRIIGKGGEGIRSLEKAHNVTIAFGRKDGEIIVTGKMSGCEACKNAIEAIRDETWEEFYIPADLVKFVVGKNFSTLKRIKLTYGVEVTLPKSGRSRVLLRGPTVEKVYAAKKDILETLPAMTLRWDVGERLADGRIIGSGRDTIQRLCKEHGVKIIPLKKGGKAYIWGEKSNCKTARDEMIAIIFDELEKTEF